MKKLSFEKTCSFCALFRGVFCFPRKGTCSDFHLYHRILILLFKKKWKKLQEIQLKNAGETEASTTWKGNASESLRFLRRRMPGAIKGRSSGAAYAIVEKRPRRPRISSFSDRRLPADAEGTKTISWQLERWSLWMEQVRGCLKEEKIERTTQAATRE